MRRETEVPDQSWSRSAAMTCVRALLLVVRGDGVLEVEHDDVGAQLRRLLEHPPVAARHGELGAVEAGWSRHGPGSVRPHRPALQAVIAEFR